MKSKSLKVLSLVLLATGLASGAAYARGGGGMGNMAGPGTTQADPARNQERVQNRVQKRDGSHAGGAQRNENRYEFRHENREQVRSERSSSAGR